MKLNWAERLVVNNPARVAQQGLEIRWLKKKRPLAPGGTVLEVGCGRGAAARLIQKAFGPRHLALLDLDEAMAARASGAAKRNGARHTTVASGDVSCLPFKSGVFDAVFGFGVLHHVEDWRAGLSEIARVLRPGGVYYMEELYPGLYQNRITRMILLHPAHDRFEAPELHGALPLMDLHPAECFEIGKIGILAVLVKAGA